MSCCDTHDGTHHTFLSWSYFQIINSHFCIFSFLHSKQSLHERPGQLQKLDGTLWNCVFLAVFWVFLSCGKKKLELTYITFRSINWQQTIKLTKKIHLQHLQVKTPTPCGRGFCVTVSTLSGIILENAINTNCRLQLGSNFQWWNKFTVIADKTCLNQTAVHKMLAQHVTTPRSTLYSWLLVAHQKQIS